MMSWCRGWVGLPFKRRRVKRRMIMGIIILSR
jgi:hypothetical protein